MTLAEIKTKIETTIDHSIVTMGGDGCSCSATVVVPIFEGMSLINRQKMVLTTVRENIDNGDLHAPTIKTRAIRGLS